MSEVCYLFKFYLFKFNLIKMCSTVTTCLDHMNSFGMLRAAHKVGKRGKAQPQGGGGGGIKTQQYFNLNRTTHHCLLKQ